jgi:hypothetical protein
MPATATAFAQAKQLIRKHGLDGLALKLALVSSDYVPSAAHTIWADISANEIAATGNYTAGGATVAGVSVAADGSVDATDVTWAEATLTFRYGVVYISGTLDGKVNPVLFYYLYDDTPDDVSVNLIDFTHVWTATGVLV